MKNRDQPHVWRMVEEAVRTLRGTISRREIANWIQRSYPGTNRGTVGCQTTICTVNNARRVGFAQNRQPRIGPHFYDVLFEEKSGLLARYSPKKHGIWGIKSTRGGGVKIFQRRLDSVVEEKIPSARLHILYCGSPRQNDDYATLQRLAKTNGSDAWSSLKHVASGDRALFYTVDQQRAFVASGRIKEASWRTNDSKDFPFRSEVGDICAFSTSCSIECIKREFPKWRWLRNTRNITTVPDEIADRLWRFVHKEATMEPPDELTKAIKQIGKMGAGFGDPKTNRLVERAAIDAVTRRLVHEGYKVQSRESDKLGYDLEARKGRRRRHVEVKGVSGTQARFIVTRREIREAAADLHWELMVVTQARSSRPQIERFLGRDMLCTFSLEPLVYFADIRDGKKVP